MITNQNLAEPFEIVAQGVEVVFHRPAHRSAGSEEKRQAVVQALKGVDFGLAEGEIVALVGESGSGKTTLARTLCGLQEPSAGELSFGGMDFRAAPRAARRERRRVLQIVYQNPYEALDDHFTVRRTLEEPLRIQGCRARQVLSDRVDGALQMVDLPNSSEFLDRRPYELSGGQRQRVAIASALVLRPRLLIADEPVSMLDVSVRGGILRVLRRLRDEASLGVLLVTHDLSVAACIADRIAVMYAGRIIEQGSTVEILRGPRHPYTRGLIAVAARYARREGDASSAVAGEIGYGADLEVGCAFASRCRLAQSDCLSAVPPLDLKRGSGSHLVACFHPQLS
jgi:oligopeptide/dipeptide ABC transporter ATP-binding protein